MRNPLYVRDAMKLLKDNKKKEAYFVSGFMVAEGAIWNRASTTENGGSFNASVPVSASIGLPTCLDMGVNPSFIQRSGHEHSCTTAVTEIFAMAYCVLKLRRRIDKSEARYLRTELAMGATPKAKDGHLVMALDYHNVPGEGQQQQQEDEEAEDEEDEQGELEISTGNNQHPIKPPTTRMSLRLEFEDNFTVVSSYAEDVFMRSVK
jgi:hypothetical protein